MKYRKVENGFLIRLEKGEEVIGTLGEFVREQNIRAAQLSGIGAVADATIGIFSSQLNQYITKMYRGFLEVGNITGSISIEGETGEPFVHAHITVSNEQYGTLTGHLFEATVIITLEIFLRTFKEELIRRKDTDLEYPFWQL